MVQLGIGRRRLQWLGRFSFLVQRPYEWLTATDTLHTPIESRQRAALLAMVLLMFACIVYSHPLTPFFVLASVTALVFFRRCTPRWLPLLMAIIIALWLMCMAQPFLAGHPSMVFGDLGQAGDNLTASVTSRVVQGNPEHTFIAVMRVIMTGFIWLFACLGGVRRLHKGRRDITYILLAVAAFPLIIVQQYGGEMFLRIYLFTLPLMVFFAATSTT
jgi:hypothetical protein